MAKYIGRRVDIGIAPEATRGVGVAATHSISKMDYDLFDKADKATSEESFSNIAGYGAYEIVTSKRAEGSISGEINARSYALWLWATFGTLSSAAEGAGYKHTISVNNSNQHKTLSLHTSEDNGDKIFEGVMVDSHEITITPGEIVKFNCGLKSYIGRDSSFTASYPANNYKFVGRDVTFKVAATTADLAAATAISTKEITLTINKNTEFDNVNGTLEPEDIHNKQMQIEGSLTLNFEDETWRDYMVDGSYKAMNLLLQDTRDDLGGGVYPSLYFEFSRCAFSEWERDVSNDDICTQTINFKALYDLTNGNVLNDCYVINDVASY